MRPTKKQIAEAVAFMGGGCRFFPSGEDRQVVMKIIEQMVPTKEALDWLVAQMVNHVGVWNGSSELRGVLCCRFRPLDGVEATCALSIGYRPSDGEQRYLEKQAEEQKLLAAGQKLLAGPPPSPEELAASEAARTATVGLFSRARTVPEAPRYPEEYYGAKDPGIAPRCAKCHGSGYLAKDKLCDCKMAQDIAKVMNRGT